MSTTVERTPAYEHAHDDAIVAIIGEFWKPLGRAFVAVRPAVENCGRIGRFPRIVLNQSPVEPVCFALQLVVEHVEELEANFGIALRNA